MLESEEILEAIALAQFNGWNDPTVRIRILQDLMSRWETQPGRSGEEIFLVRTRKNRENVDIYTVSESAMSTQHQNGIYLADGKLNAPFLLRNAEILLQSGDCVLAKNIYQTLIKAGAKSAQAWLGIGRCFESENKLEDARKAYQESIAFYPQLEAYRLLASVCLRQDKPLSAADIFERALNLKEITPKVRGELHKAAGNAFAKSKHFKEAEAHYHKALELDPMADDLRSNMGAILVDQGKLDDAKRCFEDALAANPANARALAGLGSIALSQGDKRLAHDLFAKSLGIDIQNPLAIFYLVKCAYDIRSYAVAARITEEYIQVAPVNVNLLYSLAGLQFHLGRLVDARSTVDRMLQLSPEHAGARELLAMIAKYERTSH